MDIVKKKETVVFDTDKLKVDDIILYRNKDNIENFVGKIAIVSEFELKIHKLVRSTAIGVTDTIRPNEIESGDVVITKLVPENKTEHKFIGCNYCSSAISTYGDSMIDNDHIEVSINWREKELDIYAINTIGAEISIHYCPMCGRELGESDE